LDRGVLDPRIWKLALRAVLSDVGLVLVDDLPVEIHLVRNRDRIAVQFLSDDP
jgi:hypothetical protein